MEKMIPLAIVTLVVFIALFLMMIKVEENECGEEIDEFFNIKEDDR